MRLTKEDIIKISGKDSLDQILKLDLSNKDLDEVDIKLLNQMTSLEVLNLADNRIMSIRGLCLPNLRHLDLSNNLIMDFNIESLNSLEELVLFGNHLNVTEHYIAVDQLPNLKKLDRKQCQALRHTIQRVEERISSQVESIWNSEYASQLGPNFTDTEAASVMTNFARQLTQSLFIPEVASKYKLYKVNTYAKKMMDQKYKERRLQRPGESNGPVIHKVTKAFSLTQEFPTTTTPIPTKPTSRKRKASSQPENETASKTSRVEETESDLKPSDLEPIQLLRCHSDSASDEDTQVWAAEFDPQDPDVVATCGGDSICFINCRSGRVVQKYQHADSSESFYTLSWSHLATQGSILAAAGKNNSIHLVWPQKDICYKSFKAHQDTINCLVFDPSCPTSLYSASDDKKIHMWDVGIPTESDYNVTIKKKYTFNAKMGVIRIAVTPPQNTSPMLLAAGDGKLIGWHLSSLSKGSALVTFELPWVHSTPLVDGLVFLSKDIVCSKESQSGKLLVWDLMATMDCCKTAGHKPVSVPCTLTHDLSWKKDCKFDFIYPDTHPGSRTVYCGDDKGQVWIYKLQDGSYTQSLLEWPGEMSTNKSGKLLVNNLAVSKDGRHLVVCTNLNLIAIWRDSS